MKMLIIPVMLVIAYILFIDAVSQMNFVEQVIQPYAYGGSTETVGFGQAVSVSARRPYLFGLFYLPTYSAGFGYIGGWHDAFFAFVTILTIALLLLEFKHRKEINVVKIRPKREMNMSKSMNLLSYVKILAYGLIFVILAQLISVMISGDYNNIPIFIGLLVIYMEYKFSKTKEKVKK